MAGIYIHIPFCASKCTYCDFASFPKEIGKQEAYFACLYKEMRSRLNALKGKQFDTVYFGGGTPSFVKPEYILGAMRLIKEYVTLPENAEITLEVNPGTIDRNKLRVYKQAGINRFSLGLQSADDDILKDIGRIHTKADFLSACKMLSGYNLSADVMIGLKNQTVESIKRAIDVCVEGGVKHISLYALKAEVGTPIYNDYLNGELPSEDEVADFYEAAYAYFKEKGFERYEVSNFALKGFESRHNLNYWKRGEYIGFGVAASSFMDGRRFTNVFTIDEYVHLLLNGKYPEASSEVIGHSDAKFEFVMLALRTSRGVVFAEYEKAFSSDFKKDFAAALAAQGKFLEENAERIRIKDEFLFVQNSIIIGFLE